MTITHYTNSIVFPFARACKLRCTWIATRLAHNLTNNRHMNLTQFEPETRKRIEEHLKSYKAGKLIPYDGDFESTTSDVLYISADTIKEARAIMGTAILLGHFTAYIGRCYHEHDCCGCVSTSDISLKRIGEWSFIAIHSFTINV